MKIIIRAAMLLSVIAFANSAHSAASKDLQEISDTFTVYPSHWASGSCKSTVDYIGGSGSQPDRLSVNFMSQDGPVSFSIYGVVTSSSKKDAPGLHSGPNWYEGSTFRVNYSYVSYVDSLSDFNLPPSAHGRYRLEAYVSSYPMLKEAVQLEFWVQEVSTKKVVFSADLAFARNCK